MNGICSCGAKNAFAGIHVWTESALIPAIREDTESTMTITSANAPGDWWKVKAESCFATEPGHTYEAVYSFTSNISISEIEQVFRAIMPEGLALA